MRSLKELMDLRERVAVITGGAGHLGRVIGDALAELGAALVILDKPDTASQEVAKHIHRVHGVRVLPLVVDISQESAVRSVPEQVLREFNRLDILVNCAALVGASELSGWAVPFAQQRIGPWRLALDVNLTAPFVLTQACAEALAASGHGSVINIASIYGVVAPDLRLYAGTSLGNPAAYAASKGGLLQLTRWLATTLAPPIRVNAITPGGIERDQPAAFRARYCARTPLNRMATEEDLKGAVAYLASDLSAYVTGQNLIVDGGWTVW